MPTPVIKLFGRHCFSGKKDGFQEQQTVLIQSFKIGDDIRSRRYPVDGIDPSFIHKLYQFDRERKKLFGNHYKFSSRINRWKHSGYRHAKVKRRLAAENSIFIDMKSFCIPLCIFHNA